MAKDFLGREITDPALVRMQNTMNKEPVMTTAGRALASGGRTMADASVAGVKGVGTVANNLPRLAAMPAVGALNIASTQLQNLKNGINNTNTQAPQFQALTATDAFQRAFPPATPALAVAPVAKPVPPLQTTVTSSPVAGAGLPSAAQIASDKARASAAQTANDTALGLPTAGAPAAINVSRQPNGVLSFTGSGGDGTGAVKYSGLPQWTSQRGGAGQGAVGGGFNLAEQNQRMAVALQGIQAGDRQKEADNLISGIAGGAGGPVGVARNTLAMQQLGPLLERQMSTTSAENINQTNDATRRNDAALGFAGDMARVAASRYGTDVGAKTADKGFEVEKQKAADAIVAAQSKVAAGKPPSVKDQTALFVFSGRNADGTQRTPAQQAALEMRYAATFGNRDSYMGLIGSEEE